MQDVLISGAISLLLVFIETIGIIVSKWFVVGTQAEKKAIAAMANAAANYSGDDSRKLECIAQAGDQARLEVRRELAASVIPGPEFSFLSFTMMVTLFLSYFYSNDPLKKLISPLLFSSGSNYPILLLAMLGSLFLWLMLYWWREVLITCTQVHFKRLSMSAIVILGVVNLSSCIYLVLAGR